MKKGFTLIELLAVIVVLAILALVVTPIVLNIVENAQTGADERSLEGYAKVIQTTFYDEKMNNTALTLASYIETVDLASKEIEALEEGTTTYTLAYSGNKVQCPVEDRKVVPDEKGSLQIELNNCIVNGRGPYNFVEGKAYKVEDFKITTNLNNVTIDNKSTTIKSGETYVANVIIKEGYQITNNKVLMNGKDITDYSIDKNGKITIEKVTGDIEIKIETVKKSYSITKTLTNVTISPTTSTISYGESYSATLTPKNLYSIDKVTVTMGGTDITSDVYSNGTITISKVTGNIKITASAVQTTFTVINNLTNVTTNNSALTAEKGKSYSATLTPLINYSMEKVTVKMGGTDISSMYSNGIIYIEKVTGNIEITASAISQFEIDSWETIVSNVKNGNTSIYNVGDTKVITLTSSDTNIAGTYTVRIANKSNTGDVCTKETNDAGETYSKTACGFVIEFADIISDQKMNPSGEYKGTNYVYGWNKDGWPASSMYSYVNNDIYNALPLELKNAIIDTTAVSGYGSGDSPNKVSTDKLYLLATAEIWTQGSTNNIINDTARDVTRQLDYYSNLGVTTNNYSAATKGNAIWWLRSVFSDLPFSFYGVSRRGSWNNPSAYSTYGVAPAFRIG